MTRREILFEGTDGANATTANSGASVINPGGGTIKFSSAAGLHGTGIRFATTASGQYCIGRWNFLASNNQVAFSGVFTTPPAWAADVTIGGLKTTADSLILRFLIDQNTQFRCATGSGGPIGANQKVTVTPGTRYRVRGVVTGGSTTAGVITVHLYSMANALLGTWSATGLDLTTNAIANAELGHSGSNVSADIDWDELILDDGGVSEPADYNSNATPVANAGPDQNLFSWQPFTLDGTGSTDSDGTITDYTWSQLSGPATALSSTTAVQPTGTAPQGPATLVYSLTVTDDGGATSTADTVTINVAAPGSGSATVAYNRRIWTGTAWL